MSSIRNIDKYPVENAYILDKLRKMVPDLNERYPTETSHLEAKIGYWYAASYMYNKNITRARDSLRSHKYRNLVFFVLYLATYLPISIWNTLQRLRRIIR